MRHHDKSVFRGNRLTTQTHASKEERFEIQQLLAKRARRLLNETTKTPSTDENAKAT